MDYGKLCKEILDLDQKIRYAGVCDDTGETKFGGQRKGVENLFSSEETKRSNLQALARWALRNTLSPKLATYFDMASLYGCPEKIFYLVF
jgi:hypothetical protein